MWNSRPSQEQERTLSGDSHPKVRRFEDPLDIWLKQELRKMYDGVLAEPLPDPIADLLQEYEERVVQERPTKRTNGS